MLKNIYKLNLLANGKPVQFMMNVDESLKPVRIISNKITDEWHCKLQGLVEYMFGKEKE